MGEYYSTIRRPLFRTRPEFNACACRCSFVRDGHRTIRFGVKATSGIDGLNPQPNAAVHTLGEFDQPECRLTAHDLLPPDPGSSVDPKHASQTTESRHAPL